ncbi:PREDICTED: uncharacterized protein LOC107187657 [Dufourea novaeangliae]|uniref:uncharacterized protein LOC107187657 n=1 Tax=Dufourea novaeangliae TaxID=178035 RepID=UPI0007674882|nr:PREDICTED: uncharacterized protein LOC107187657 [Dufourea novaeangliae]
MLGRKVVTVFVLCLAVLASGMPQSPGYDNQQPSLGLPFLQFTNGGIRFNFGGYHAEAGLGGLLGGSKTGGGLHASAGTPWGANAAAGLGGLLSGDSAGAQGGLYARANLGNGGPAAGAGLGGVLDGSGRSVAPARGGLYAGATTGAQVVHPPENGIRKTNEATDIIEKPVKSRTNIQIITRSEKKPEKLQQAPSDSAYTLKEVDQSADKVIRNIETVKAAPIASAGVFGALAIEPAPQAPVLAQVEKVKTIGGLGAIEPAPLAPPLQSQINEIVEVVPPQPVRVVYPKWVWRKRLLGHRKQIIHNTSVEVQDPSNLNTQKVSRRQAQDVPRDAYASGTNVVPVEYANKNDGVFDDVFNIPISTLNAVNQLLNRNAG